MATKVLPDSHALIPGDAEIAFKGIMYDVYQWQQRMFDGSYKTFEMLRRPDTLQIIVIKDDALLLIDDEQPGRSVRRHFPGGRHDTGESWLEGAKRELREETGLVCTDWRLIDVRQPIIKIEWFIPIYLAWNISDELPQKLDVGGEKISMLWQGFDQVRNSILDGDEQMMQYLIPFFNTVRSLKQLTALPEFSGTKIER